MIAFFCVLNKGPTTNANAPPIVVIRPPNAVAVVLSPGGYQRLVMAIRDVRMRGEDSPERQFASTTSNTFLLLKNQDHEETARRNDPKVMKCNPYLSIRYDEGMKATIVLILVANRNESTPHTGGTLASFVML